jgi:ribonuclease BN (tRNA processing enzyme)
LLLLLLSACQTNPGERFAMDVPSAIVEIREAITDEERNAETRVVILGTGTPVPDPRRAGPGIAVIHRGNAYLFDAGAGVVRNATTARYQYDIPSLYPSSIKALFLTHMHSDHTADFSVLASSIWWRRPYPLHLYGPSGVAEMTEGMRAMMAPDYRIRTGGTQPVRDEWVHPVQVTEVTEGIVFEDRDIQVEAFAVNHGSVTPAYGYKITAHDKTIVISGDTARSEKLIEKSHGVDLLIHEVISDKGLLWNRPAMQEYHKKSHTLATELGRIASETRPGLLVLYHGLFYGQPESIVLDEVRSTYDGPVVLADDMDIF